MPDTFTLKSKISCPNCGTPVLNSARFQWGEVPGQVYEIGDQINWVHGDNGEIVTPFKLRLTAPSRWRWNCGDPHVRQAILLDEDVYTGNHSLSCGKCDFKISAISCKVMNNRISSSSALSDDDLGKIIGKSLGKANIITIDNLNKFAPREDWYDHPINIDEESLKATTKDR